MTYLNTDFGTQHVSFDMGYEAQVGEPVLVTPCQRHSGGRTTALEDSAVASHATFAWRGSHVVLAKKESGTLRYKSFRMTAQFSGISVPHGLRPADRITRSWDGAVFEVVAVHANGRDSISCDLVELSHHIH